MKEGGGFYTAGDDDADDDDDDDEEEEPQGTDAGAGASGASSASAEAIAAGSSTGDGWDAVARKGFLLDTKKAGDGCTFPSPGDWVTVSFTGTEDPDADVRGVPTETAGTAAPGAAAAGVGAGAAAAGAAAAGAAAAAAAVAADAGVPAPAAPVLPPPRFADHQSVAGCSLYFFSRPLHSLPKSATYCFFDSTISMSASGFVGSCFA